MGVSSVVLSRRNVSGLEIDWLTRVDLWETYALFTRFRSTPDERLHS
jgi:hypothetical protein